MSGQGQMRELFVALCEAVVLAAVNAGVGTNVLFGPEKWTSNKSCGLRSVEVVLGESSLSLLFLNAVILNRLEAELGVLGVCSVQSEGEITKTGRKSL